MLFTCVHSPIVENKNDIICKRAFLHGGECQILFFMIIHQLICIYVI